MITLVVISLCIVGFMIDRKAKRAGKSTSVVRALVGLGVGLVLLPGGGFLTLLGVISTVIWGLILLGALIRALPGADKTSGQVPPADSTPPVTLHSDPQDRS